MISPSSVSSGGPIALPSRYRRTARPEFDKSSKRNFFFRALELYFAPGYLNIWSSQYPHGLLTSLFLFQLPDPLEEESSSCQLAVSALPTPHIPSHRAVTCALASRQPALVIRKCEGKAVVSLRGCTQCAALRKLFENQWPMASCQLTHETGADGLSHLGQMLCRKPLRIKIMR